MSRRLINEIYKYNVIYENKYKSNISHINGQILNNSLSIASNEISNTNGIINIQYNILLFPLIEIL